MTKEFEASATTTTWKGIEEKIATTLNIRYRQCENGMMGSCSGWSPNTPHP